MHTILIANPKGGCGKTTLATNVAGFLAGSRQRVAIADDDPQQSAAFWLGRRPELFPKIALAPADARERKDFDWIVVDSPAGMHGDQLRDEMRRADAVLIPLTPSVFDMAATARFLHTIADYKAVKGGELPIGLVAMRFDARTHSATELDEFLAACKLPVVGHLRDTQVYVWCARDGASVFDLPRSRAEQDWEQWKPLARWIAKIPG